MSFNGESCEVLKWSDFEKKVQEPLLTAEEYLYAKKILHLLGLFMSLGIKLERIILILERVLQFCRESENRRDVKN